MINALLGKKLKQTQTYTEEGQRWPVTDVQLGPCTIVQLKTQDHDGYNALQLGFDKTTKKITKSLSGHFKKTGLGNYLPRFLQEVRVTDIANFKVGEQLTLDKVFQLGDMVKVTGISKAKGFQGGVKRHGFAGGPRTHGQSDRERAPGAIGQTTTPGRVYRGKRMAGHMGGAKVTISGLKIVSIDPEHNIVRIKGLIPGNINSYVIVQK